MWLLLCTADDHPALWAAQRLRARGLTPLVVLTPELLTFSFRWQHRLDNEHSPSTQFTLASGQTIRSAEISGVLNRIAAMPAHVVEHLPLDDRAYALQEWTALHMSWLSSLPVPVLNRPVMEGLCGAWRHQSEWTSLAAAAGLETAAFRQGTGAPETQVDTVLPALTHTVVVVDDQVAGEPLPAPIESACVRLAALCGTRLLGIDLEIGTHRFAGASPRPDLRFAGEAVVDALQMALAGH